MPDTTPPATGPGPLARAGYGPTDDDGAAAREWWDGNAASYHAEHAVDLGRTDFLWGPDGLREEQAGLLGDLTGLTVLEIGAGTAPCARWLAARGVCVVATDVSQQMLAIAARENVAAGVAVPLVQADARHLPFDDGTFDAAFTSYGALPFVPDARDVHSEVGRVLRPGGRWVFSVTHPVRWAFPDDPTDRGLVASRSYFDRTPYIEVDEAGRTIYAEYHRTLGDHVRDVVASGFALVDVVEPEWPAGRTSTWGGWSPLRGALLPGTAVFLCERVTTVRPRRERPSGAPTGT